MYVDSRIKVRFLMDKGYILGCFLFVFSRVFHIRRSSLPLDRSRSKSFGVGAVEKKLLKVQITDVSDHIFDHMTRLSDAVVSLHKKEKEKKKEKYYM